MAKPVILVDTSILIDYYRKTLKEHTVWIALVRQEYDFAVSAVTRYEIFSGANPEQLNFWNAVFRSVMVVPLDEASVDAAVRINTQLKRKRKQIDLADLFIGATAVAHGLALATLNKKHFDRIEGLSMIP